MFLSKRSTHSKDLSCDCNGLVVLFNCTEVGCFYLPELPPQKKGGGTTVNLDAQSLATRLQGVEPHGNTAPKVWKYSQAGSTGDAARDLANPLAPQTPCSLTYPPSRNRSVFPNSPPAPAGGRQPAACLGQSVRRSSCTATPPLTQLQSIRKSMDTRSRSTTSPRASSAGREA